MATESTYREVLQGPLTPEHIDRRQQEGWRAVAVEWHRQEAGAASAILPRQEIPYGLRVAEDGLHLEEHPEEVATLGKILELITEDRPLVEVAAELERLGQRDRQGRPWTQVRLFDLLPRLVETAPQIFAGPEWSKLRELRQRGDRLRVVGA